MGRIRVAGLLGPLVYRRRNSSDQPPRCRLPGPDIRARRGFVRLRLRSALRRYPLLGGVGVADLLVRHLWNPGGPRNSHWLACNRALGHRISPRHRLDLPWLWLAPPRLAAGRANELMLAGSGDGSH